MLDFILKKDIPENQKIITPAFQPAIQSDNV